MGVHTPFMEDAMPSPRYSEWPIWDGTSSQEPPSRREIAPQHHDIMLTRYLEKQAANRTSSDRGFGILAIATSVCSRWKEGHVNDMRSLIIGPMRAQPPGSCCRPVSPLLPSRERSVQQPVQQARNRLRGGPAVDEKLPDGEGHDMRYQQDEQDRG